MALIKKGSERLWRYELSNNYESGHYWENAADAETAGNRHVEELKKEGQDVHVARTSSAIFEKENAVSTSVTPALASPDYPPEK